MPLSTFAAHTFRPDTFSAETLNGVQGTTGTFEVFLNDSVSVVDALLLEVHYSRSVVASVLALDYVSNETTKGLTDAIAIADAASPYLDASRALADSLTATDALAIQSDYIRTGNDSVATADAGTTTLAFARASTDNAVVLDDLTVDLIRPAVGEGYAEDSITVTDAAATEAIFGRTNADLLSALDTTSPAIDALRSPQDIVSVLDALSIEVARTLADSIISATRPAPEIPVNNAPPPLAPREQLGIYGYIVVQRLPVTFATPFHAYPQQLRLLEDQMRKFGVKAERAETYTGLAVYRVSGDALWRVPTDRQGRFLSWSSLKWRIFTTNPIAETDLRSPWRPI